MYLLCNHYYLLLSSKCFDSYVCCWQIIIVLCACVCLYYHFDAMLLWLALSKFIYCFYNTVYFNINLIWLDNANNYNSDHDVFVQNIERNISCCVSFFVVMLIILVGVADAQISSIKVGQHSFPPTINPVSLLNHRLIAVTVILVAGDGGSALRPMIWFLLLSTIVTLFVRLVGHGSYG